MTKLTVSRHCRDIADTCFYCISKQSHTQNDMYSLREIVHKTYSKCQLLTFLLVNTPTASFSHGRIEVEGKLLTSFLALQLLYIY